MPEKRAPYNRTITITNDELAVFQKKLIKLTGKTSIKQVLNKTINQDFFEAVKFLPEKSVDLLFLDPPYNLYKKFNNNSFKKLSLEAYNNYLETLFELLLPLLKDTASIYICGDYYSSTSIHLTALKYFKVQNRITWQREKGRGAKANWKNSSEDIWFCTKTDKFNFYVDRVKEKRRVLAPYKENGKPKDWAETEEGNFRLTCPSNIWTDLTVPYWSMPENTDHPTQKPEKLLAKLILASSNEGDVVLDPFLGSGTTSVTAKKLNRKYIGIELETLFASLAEKRLLLAEKNKTIQGYEDGVFWERNSFLNRKKSKK